VDLAARQPPPVGVLHIAGGGVCSWYEFAREIVATAGVSCEVRPCTTAEMPRPATRPGYSVLRSERDAPFLAEWQRGLAEYMALTRAVSAS